MKSLKTLIRLQRFELDAKRRKLADLEELLAEMKQRLRRLEEDMVDEGARAADQGTVALAYGPYIAAALERKRNLLGSLGELENRIAEARDEVAEAFQDVKKYELAEAARVARERAELAKKEREMLDEVGSIGFNRRASEQAPA